MKEVLITSQRESMAHSIKMNNTKRRGLNWNLPTKGPKTSWTCSMRRRTCSILISWKILCYMRIDGAKIVANSSGYLPKKLKLYSQMSILQKNHRELIMLSNRLAFLSKSSSTKLLNSWVWPQGSPRILMKVKIMTPARFKRQHSSKISLLHHIARVLNTFPLELERDI